MNTEQNYALNEGRTAKLGCLLTLLKFFLHASMSDIWDAGQRQEMDVRRMLLVSQVTQELPEFLSVY